MYNAYERDIAVVNIFFGQSTAFGKSTSWKFLIPPLSPYNRVLKSGKDDLVWFRLQYWGHHWSHPRHQLCLYSRAFLLALHQILQKSDNIQGIEIQFNFESEENVCIRKLYYGLFSYLLCPSQKRMDVPFVLLETKEQIISILHPSSHIQFCKNNKRVTRKKRKASFWGWPSSLHSTLQKSLSKFRRYTNTLKLLEQLSKS